MLVIIPSEKDMKKPREDFSGRGLIDVLFFWQ